MIAQHQTVFKEDLVSRKMTVTREFEAPVNKVWRAWTERELLDKWWAPKPWKAETKSMDFREGGRWLYDMKGPEGEVHHAICEYYKIVPQKTFKGKDAFCDENGNINKEMPQMDWAVNFIDKGDTTVVEVNITFESDEAMKQITEMGFKEGFTAAHGNLDELLAES